MNPTTSPSLSVSVFDRLSGFYDTEILQALVYRPTQDQVLEQLRALAPARVLDVGCGTGQLTARLHTEVGAAEVFGCDAAPGMLVQAQARSSDVTWLEGTAERIPLPDGAVDAIVSTEAFHWFDQPAALREFHRVLAPGGRLVLAFVSPRSPIGASVLNANPFLFGSGRWPHRAGMRDLATHAGFRVVRQRRVRRVLGNLIPTVITVAERVE